MIDQGELFDIPSPCKGICVSNNRGYCKGCFRNRHERFHWHELSPFQKHQVINLCEKRKQKVIAARLAKMNQAIPTTGEPSPQEELFPIQKPNKQQPNTANLPAPRSKESPLADDQISLFGQSDQ